MRAIAAIALLFAVKTPALAGEVRFDFETGDMQGWTVVEGKFDRTVADFEYFHNRPNEKFNKQGKYYLTTIEKSDGSRTDQMTGVIESPVFLLSGPQITFLVHGGSHKDTYVALCTVDGREELQARGRNTETFQRIKWNVPQLVGKQVFIRIVDHNRGGWGHVGFDDFVAEGEIDEKATQAFLENREQRLQEARICDEIEEIRKAIPPLRLAVEDLIETQGRDYRFGPSYLSLIENLEGELPDKRWEKEGDATFYFNSLKREALIDNPLVRGQPILYVERKQYKPDHHNTATMFQNGEINTGSFEGGGAIKTVVLGYNGVGDVKTLLEISGGVARDPEVHFSGEKIVFSMRRNKADDYHIYEMNVDGSGLNQLTFGSELSDIDPLYLPDGRICFVSTREPKYCQCNRHIMGNLFVMDADGANIHQIGRNTLFEGHPSLMPDGSILYDRWEYVDKHFGPAFGLWTVNPDGTNHAVYYGNNAWSPGCVIDARIIPGTQRFIATLGSCHDRPWGALAIVDRTRGMDGTKPIVRSWPADISGMLETQGYNGIDIFKSVNPKYEDPYPLSEKYFLCSRQVEGERMGIFLVDVFGNELDLWVGKRGCFDPMPVKPRHRPPAIPPRIDFAKDEGRFYVTDVYEGYGMQNVQRGAIKWLRVVEAPPKLFWCQKNWNIDATQAPAMNWNCTSNKRILGKVPVYEDGSAYFSVPADKFVFFQLLDENDMMIHSMRSGTMVRPGETLGCVGCHESRLTAGYSPVVSEAVRRGVSELEPWYGSPRDFNYLTEVQPVFDRHCVSCHDYGEEAGDKLNLAGDLGLVFNTSYLDLRSKSPVRWSADKPGAEKVLVKAVDDGPPEVLPAWSWGSHRSRLVDVIRKNHYDVKLDKESFERIVTWIDMNAPYYGSYASVYPNNAFGRSPLDDRQLKRLQDLTGLPVGTQNLEMKGSQISFTRPEKSVCLEGFQDANDPKYRDALEIVRDGQAMLARQPRMDMPGAALVGVEIERQQKYDQMAREELAVRRAIVQGDKRYSLSDAGEKN